MSEKVRNIWKKIKKIPKQRLIRIGIISVLIIVLMLLIIIASESKKEHDRKESIKEETEKYEIAFENERYTCEEGKEIDVMLKPKKREFPNDIYVVSSDTSIATVDNNADLKCDNCKKVTIKCQKKGNIELKAIANEEILSTTSLEIKEEVIKAAFEKNAYSCLLGESFETTIKMAKGDSIKSIKASGYGLIILDTETSPPTCENCKKIEVVCEYGSSFLGLYDPQKVGLAPYSSIRAETENGEIATAAISFDVKTSLEAVKDMSSTLDMDVILGYYVCPSLSDGCSCKVGDKIPVGINSNNLKERKLSANIISWGSKDSKIAKIEKVDYTPPSHKSNNPSAEELAYVHIPPSNAPVQYFLITCLSPGSTHVYAESENHFYGSRSIIVYE